MRRIQRTLAAISMLAVVACASTANTQYVALGVTVHSVDLAMKTWAQYVTSGHGTDDQQAQVNGKYEAYRGVARNMKLVLVATSTEPTPEELGALAKSLIDLIQQFTGKKLAQVTVGSGGAA